MLELTGLTSHAGDFVMDPVSLHVGHGDCHVILGPTGSGKTVLLETILGLRDAAAGSVHLDETDVTNMPAELRGIGYVPQDLALFPHFTVMENIRYGNRVRHKINQVQDDLINELISAVRIENLLDRLPGNLSGGERQRVALVRAIASGSKILLLDEPFSSVNESLRKDLWLMMRQLQERFALTLLMITHDLEEAFFLGDRLSVLINGKVHQSDSKRNVYQQPATREVAQFFGIKNVFSGRLNKTNVRVTRLNADLDIARHAGVMDARDVTVGIRSNEVMILREGADQSRWENTLSGHVHEIMDKGAAYTVLFSPDKASDITIEIELNSHAYRKLDIYLNKEISISLKKENLFVIHDT